MERFRETQWARENAIISIPFVIVLVSVIAALAGLLREGSSDLSPLQSLALSAWLVGFVGLYAWFLRVGRLETVVDDVGLRIRWYPLHLRWRQIPLEGVERVEAVKYRPIWEYGGYGIRMGLRSRAYNVVGNQGVRLHYEGGRHLLIGSRRPEELAEAVRSILLQGP